MDGYQATRLIRDPATGAAPPAYPDRCRHRRRHAGDREKCLRAGMDDYVSKPIEPEEIAATLDKWLAPWSRRPFSMHPAC